MNYNIHREEIWVTPIWSFEIPFSMVHPSDIERECYVYADQEPGRLSSNVGGYQSNDMFLDSCPLPAITHLMEVIHTMTSQCSQEFGYDTHRKMDNFWININKPYDANNPHVHPGAVFSGVYYAKTNNDSGDLNFYPSPEIDYIMGMSSAKQNKYNMNNMICKAVVGRVIMFPSWVMHGVGTNRSDQDRISLSFNMS
jgi:uncharacterized protein (TIGR02466 family)